VSIVDADLLIIGGGPAGLAAASGYRDAGGRGTVVLVGDEQTAPYFRPPLSKDYLRGESGEDELALEPPSRYTELALSTRLGTEVRELDARRRSARLADGSVLRYGHCVLATGAAPRPLPVPGADDPAVAYLRSLHSARRLRDAAAGASSVVVIGSGFIGCEAAASLAWRGLPVTVVSAEPLPQSGRLGDAVGERIAGWLRGGGVDLVGGAEVGRIERGQRVELADGRTLEADLVLVAAGMRPRADLAAAAGAPVERERVVVDEQMRTDLPGLLAAGDVAFARNAAAGRHLPVEHWGEALAMGTTAGATAAGARRGWAEVPGFWSEIGDHTLKYAAWGDGYDRAELDEHAGGAFTVWYSTRGVTVGVAAHDADDDYEHGTQLVEQGAPAPR
jgi:NADPH-dependent 2,4-dienoyl-CoA reductase/sulfur reductase-like enzyme